MPRVTGQQHYCVRCHNRPVPDSVWRAGGKGSHLCEVCEANDRRKEQERQQKSQQAAESEG